MRPAVSRDIQAGHVASVVGQAQCAVGENALTGDVEDSAQEYQDTEFY